MEFREFAEQVLFATTLEEKLRCPANLTDEHPGEALVTPEAPGRPARLRFKPHGSGKAEFPGMHRLQHKDERGRLLHFFANHELLATELMALVLLKFPDAPPAFRKGVLQTLKDEQEHTKLYHDRMRACGIELGDLPVSGYFWRCIAPMENPIDYVAGLCLTFEQANLDFARHFARAFEKIGDADTATLLEKIYRDEIGHVAYGLKWFRRWKHPTESDWEAFCRTLKFPLSPQRAKGISLNLEGRRAAGLDPQFIAELNVYSQSKGRTPSVFVFNPFAEGRIAKGKSFNPAKHQAQLARDLENLPQFLCRQDDIVLVEKRPSVEFLSGIKQAGFPLPEFVEMGKPLTTNLGIFESRPTGASDPLSPSDGATEKISDTAQPEVSPYQGDTSDPLSPLGERDGVRGFRGTTRELVKREPLTPALSPSDGAREKISDTAQPEVSPCQGDPSDPLTPSDGERVAAGRVRGFPNESSHPNPLTPPLSPKGARERICASAAALSQRKLGRLRPWAWSPDSVELLGPLMANVTGETRTAQQRFNDGIARLYSKAWSAELLRKLLDHRLVAERNFRTGKEEPLTGPTATLSPSDSPPRSAMAERGGERDGVRGFPEISSGNRSDSPGKDAPFPITPHAPRPTPQNSESLLTSAASENWLCPADVAGVAVDSLPAALEAIAAIRRRGHHRIVVKQAVGLAGSNAMRLFEPELLETHRRWIANSLAGGQQLVVEPWLERLLDFSVQLEMTPDGLKLCGYTGLLNDAKGQFQGNWAESHHHTRIPAKVIALFSEPPISRRLLQLYAEILSLLEAELRRVDYLGPLGIDAFVYRAADGQPRLKPIVEINPRYTMGRLMVELMRQTRQGSHGRLQLINLPGLRAEGFADFAAYARKRSAEFPVQLDGEPVPRIREGFVSLNDPAQARVCLAVFEVGRDA